MLVSWREVVHRTDDALVDTILAIGTGAAPNIFTAAAINIAMIFQAEVIDMLAERYKRHRYEVGKAEGIEQGIEQGKVVGIEQGIEQGKAEGIEQGVEQGKSEGIEIGRAQERARSANYAAKLRVWVETKIKAAEEGEPFDEPMPDPDDDDYETK